MRARRSWRRSLAATIGSALNVAVLLAAVTGCDDENGERAGDTDGGGLGGEASTSANADASNGAVTGASGGDGGMGATAVAGVGPGGADGTSSVGTGIEPCIGADLLADLGEDHVLVGASLSDELAAVAQIDVRYVYLAGQLPAGDGPCASCAQACAVGGAWWGCWQSEADPPGAYVRDFAARSWSLGQIPMITYYLVLQASGAAEGAPEITAVNDAAFMRRYLADFRFMLENLEGGPALVHVEPDFWGYAQQVAPAPSLIPVAVSSANPEDCEDLADDLAGLGACLVRMARRYAPDARIGLHGSGWATFTDVLLNTDPTLDAFGQGLQVGQFLATVAPDADLVFVDAADRDAGYYASLGDEHGWDATNETLPNFEQAFSWSRGVSEASLRPTMWWQVPFGNPTLAGGPYAWQDNRLDYFFDHMDEVAAAHGVGVAFGAGADGQVTAETDGGNFLARAAAYADAGGAPLCGP